MLKLKNIIKPNVISIFFLLTPLMGHSSINEADPFVTEYSWGDDISKIKKLTAEDPYTKLLSESETYLLYGSHMNISHMKTFSFKEGKLNAISYDILTPRKGEEENENGEAQLRYYQIFQGKLAKLYGYDAKRMSFDKVFGDIVTYKQLKQSSLNGNLHAMTIWEDDQNTVVHLSIEPKSKDTVIISYFEPKEFYQRLKEARKDTTPKNTK